jgi:dTMP kinase
MTAWTEATLFASARAEHVARAIRPALEAGRHVVCDRYLDSSVAYQGIARGLGEEKVRDLSLTVTGGLLPERTFLLLVDAADALARSPDVRDRIEREDVGFMARVDAAYRSLAEAEPERIVALDGQRTPDDLQE